MAIFIIDQFSLNTDLPLDIRYVPDGGRFDPDISIYKYKKACLTIRFSSEKRNHSLR